MGKRLLCFALCLLLMLPVKAGAAEWTEQEMLSAFVDYMNQKAQAMGMENSRFNDPMGGYNFTTARDFLRLMVWADQYPRLELTWKETEYTQNVRGEASRQQTVRSTVRGSEFLEPDYEIIGCKDGELPEEDVRNLAVILQVPDSRDRLAVVVLGAYGQNSQETGSRAVVRQVAELALARHADPDGEQPEAPVYCQSAIACLIPEEGADLENLQILYERGADWQIMTASITKVLTAMCLLDVQQDLEQTFEYRLFDTFIGGFYAEDFFPGDRLTFREGLYALLLPSSNVTARALAREGGLRILEQGTPDPLAIPGLGMDSGKLEGLAGMMAGACAAGAVTE